MEELLYAMRRDQEGRQHHGLRTILKTLKEWYGKTNHSGRHFGSFQRFCPMKEALRGRRFSSDEDVTDAVQKKLYF
jgi:hypothetical protein